MVCVVHIMSVLHDEDERTSYMSCLSLSNFIQTLFQYEAITRMVSAGR